MFRTTLHKVTTVPGLASVLAGKRNKQFPELYNTVAQTSYRASEKTTMELELQPPARSGPWPMQVTASECLLLVRNKTVDPSFDLGSSGSYLNYSRISLQIRRITFVSRTGFIRDKKKVQCKHWAMVLGTVHFNSEICSFCFCINGCAPAYWILNRGEKTIANNGPATVIWLSELLQGAANGPHIYPTDLLFETGRMCLKSQETPMVSQETPTVIWI